MGTSVQTYTEGMHDSLLLGGEGLGRKLVKVPPRKSFRQHGINYAAGQAHAKAAGRVGVLLCSAVF